MELQNNEKHWNKLARQEQKSIFTWLLLKKASVQEVKQFCLTNALLVHSFVKNFLQCLRKVM